MKQRTSKRDDLTKEIIRAAAALTIASAVTAAIVILPAFGIVLKSFADWYKKQSRQKQFRIRKTFEKSRRERLINTEEKGGEVKMTLTEKGRKRILQYDFEDLQISPMKKWDKKWRMVIFDIPENQKNARRALRQKLVELGFHPLQKSVWLHPFECRDQIDFIIEFFNISPYVRMVESTCFDGDDLLKRDFNLI